jgi:hypothetical protein
MNDDTDHNAAPDILGTDIGLTRWPSREERLASTDDRMMATPHPRNRVVELMAQAMRGQDKWQSLSAPEKEIWRGFASAALQAVEPAINWSHFVTHPDDNERVY